MIVNVLRNSDMSEAVTSVRTNVFLLACLVVMLAGCGGSSSDDLAESSSPQMSPPVQPTTANPAGVIALFEPDPTDLVENSSVYQRDGYSNIEAVRVNVRTAVVPGACVESDYSGCTLNDVLADISHKDNFKPRIAVHFDSDDFADDGSVANAELRQRGGSTRKAPQKSFRVKLDDKNTLWRSERSLYLNKHPYDSSRVRNKLAFDLMSEIPHLLSSRTQFVNLWLDNGEGLEDFGLFTHVEAPGSNYLEKRGFNRDDRLYKVEHFKFSENDLKNVRLDAQGKPLDMDSFELSLEIEAGDDHGSLVEMLEAFHDPARSFDSVLDEYFNRNNVLTWMAVNLLMHQTDAVTHNFILLNPLGSKKFYFLPWDYDGTFEEEIELESDDYSNRGLQRRLYYGYARGINSEFHTKYYRLPGIHEKMIEAAEFIRNNHLTDASIAEKLNRYGEVVLPFMVRAPDNQYSENYSLDRLEKFPRHVARNLEAMKHRFSIPMPPKLEDPLMSETEWVFAWQPALDLTGHELSYDLQVSSTLSFDTDDIVLSIDGIADEPERVVHSIDRDQILAGTYYVRVIARVAKDPQQYWQVSQNIVRQDGLEYFGSVEFVAP